MLFRSFSKNIYHQDRTKESKQKHNQRDDCHSKVITNKQLSEERKAGQLAGEIPDWFITAGYQMFKEKYLYQASTIREQCERISSTAAKHLAKVGLEELGNEKFFNLLWKGWLSPSTPILSNMGTDRGMPVSCSGGYIYDSIKDKKHGNGFYSHYEEVAVLTKNGFGTSGYMGDIRPRGMPISVGGKASGVLDVFTSAVDVIRKVSQGTARRGAWAGYLPVDHGDFFELAEHLKDEPDDANIGWNFSKEFINRLESGDMEAAHRWRKVCFTKMVTGKGYFWKTDTVNEQNPPMYKDRGLEVKASNLCLRGDTIIDVECAGVFYSITIADFCEKYSLGVFYNAKVKTIKDGVVLYSPVSNAGVTGKAVELIRIETASGKIVECTPNHLIFTKNRGWVEAGELVESDDLLED